jgi:RNA recognition motif-containing protein
MSQMSRKVYVGNIGEDMTEDELQKLFMGVGTVNRVRIVTDADEGERKTFAYVEMATQEEADAAIQRMNGHQLNERKLRVRLARPSGTSKDE